MQISSKKQGEKEEKLGADWTRSGDDYPGGSNEKRAVTGAWMMKDNIARWV